MRETPYDSESLLQTLLAKYPNLLAGDQMDAKNPRRWILISQEIGVPGEQEGKGNDYKTIEVQRSKAGKLALECTINVKGNRADGPPNFAGPISQGPPTGRFIYIDMGKSAGQIDSCWQRRIKIPLVGITREMIDSMLGRSAFFPFSVTAVPEKKQTFELAHF